MEVGYKKSASEASTKNFELLCVQQNFFFYIFVNFCTSLVLKILRLSPILLVFPDFGM